MAAQSKPMTKTQLIAVLAEKTNTNKKEIAAILEALTELAYQETQKKGKFILPGLGILKLVNRAPRTGRNPITGETIQIPAKTVVKFTFSKSAKDAIMNNKK